MNGKCNWISCETNGGSEFHVLIDVSPKENQLMDEKTTNIWVIQAVHGHNSNCKKKERNEREDK